MSILVMSHVWQNSQARGTALLLLLAIADHAHDDGAGAFPSVARLAERTRMDERSVQRLIKELAGMGELEVQYQRGPGGVNLYAIPMGRQIGGSDNLTTGGVSLLSPGIINETSDIPDYVGTQSVRSLVQQHEQAIVGKRSWDLLHEVYLPAFDDCETTGQRVGLVIHYLERVTDSIFTRAERSMVAKTVREHGKVALVGWERALFATEADTSRTRMAYARGVINRVLSEMQPA